MSSLTNKILNRIKEETLPYFNFQVILDKLIQDGHLDQITQLFQNIFLQEIEFAHEEILKMQKGQFENINHLLQNNIYIFKENLKIILQTTIDQVHSNMTSQNFLNSIFEKDNRYCQIIKELSEEQFCSLIDIQSKHDSSKLLFRDPSKQKQSYNLFSNIQSQEENRAEEKNDETVETQETKNLEIQLPRYSSDLSSSKIDIDQEQVPQEKNQQKKKQKKQKATKISQRNLKKKKKFAKSLLETGRINRSIDYSTSTLYRNLNSSKDRFQITNPQRSNKSNINININISDNKKNNYLQKIFGKSINKNFKKKKTQIIFQIKFFDCMKIILYNSKTNLC